MVASSFKIREIKNPTSLSRNGVLGGSHSNLTEGYRLFLGSIFIVKLESLYKVLADWLKSDHTTPCQKTQMRLVLRLRDTHPVMDSAEIVERGACGAAAPGFQ